MVRYVLDSSAILGILLETSQGLKIKRFLNSLSGENEFATSIICYCEVLNKANLERLKQVEEFLSNLSVYPFSVQDGLIAKELLAECRSKGKSVGTLDGLIAATVVSQHAELITSDSDFSRIEGLKTHLF